MTTLALVVVLVMFFTLHPFRLVGKAVLLACAAGAYLTYGAPRQALVWAASAAGAVFCWTAGIIDSLRRGGCAQLRRHCESERVQRADRDLWRLTPDAVPNWLFLLHVASAVCGVAVLGFAVVP